MPKSELDGFDTSMFDDFNAKQVLEGVGSTLDTTGMSPHRKQPLSDMQRFIVKNIFDTQPERRRQYMKELGFELDKEGEGYRMLGDKQSQFIPLDPGISAYFGKGGFSELRKDVTDLSWDLGVAGPLEAAGAVKLGTAGAAAGTAVAPGAGTVIGGVGGAFTGAAGGAYISEAAKAIVGDIILDEDIPLDNRELFINTMMSGGFAGFGKFVKYAGSFLNKKNRKAVQEAFSEAVKNSSTGEISEEMMSQIFANPEKFTKEAAEKGTKNLLNLADELFGTGPDVARSTNQIKGGIAKKRLEELNGVEDEVYKRLKDDPAARFDLDEIDKIESDIIKHWMSNTSSLGNMNYDAARNLLKREKERLIKAAKYEKPEPTKIQMTDDPFENFKRGVESIPKEKVDPKGYVSFEQMEKFKRNLQDLGYDAAGNDLMVRGAAEIRSGAHIFRDAIRKKAEVIGAQDYLDVKDAQASVLNAYNNLRKVANEKTIHKAYLGNDDVSKQIVQRQVEELDSVLGTNLKQELETGRLQQLVTQAYRKDETLKRGVLQTVKNVGNAVVKGSVVGTTYGYATGTSPKIAGAIGGTIGAVKEGTAAIRKTSLEDKLKAATSLGDDAAQKALDSADTLGGTYRNLAPRTAGARSTYQEMSDMPPEQDDLSQFDTSAFDDLDINSLMNGNEEQQGL